MSRAHEMMGTDVTYLSEFDPATRELNVRKTAGSVTPQFQHLRVPPGMGLASQIADSRAAQWVLRYQDYAEGPHEELIDDAVAAEGIVSILGVPMLSDGQVLGVLFAATRQEYAFTPDEIAVLSALADHASVVLQTASTLEQVRRSEDEARTALDRLTEYLQVRDRSTVVHQELIEQCWSEADSSRWPAPSPPHSAARSRSSTGICTPSPPTPRRPGRCPPSCRRWCGMPSRRAGPPATAFASTTPGRRSWPLSSRVSCISARYWSGPGTSN